MLIAVSMCTRNNEHLCGRNNEHFHLAAAPMPPPAVRRLAVIPLSQEARGLDAGQRLVSRLTGAGDKRSAAIVSAIATEVCVGWVRRRVARSMSGDV